jgi:hypothetical protein
LKGDHGMPRLVAEDAVDLAPLQVAEQDEPPLQRRHRAATVAVAQITRSRHARQRKQDDEWSHKHAAARSLDAATRLGARARQQLLLAYACSPSWRPMTGPVLGSPRLSCPARQTVRLARRGLYQPIRRQLGVRRQDHHSQVGARRQDPTGRAQDASRWFAFATTTPTKHPVLVVQDVASGAEL